MQTQTLVKWSLRIVISLLVLLALVFVFRRPLMRTVGNFLIHEDELRTSEVIFVLSGNPADRAQEAARLIKSGWAPRVVCTGSQIPILFEVIDVTLDEADLSKIALCESGINEQQIEVLHIGSSTREESQAILTYCKQMNIKRLIVVSDKFHTHRINYAFRSLFEDAGVELILRGAPSSGYDEQMWWAEEAGLLMVNNEYVKLFYYFLKY
jgi:uncharacterized SAM-binding protein YcdF (DUF218 family)